MPATLSPSPIAVPESVLEDLRERLSRTRWPDRETVDDWSQGVPLDYARGLAAYWQDGYDWRRAERVLNALQPHVARLHGVDIHYLHARSPHAGARPLIITHGWPGSVLEFEHIMGPLVDPPAHGGDETDAFHVVCPSLPGFGFSGKPRAPGWGVERTATVWDALMRTLGYTRYFAQGGDWGALVTSVIGAQNRGACAAIHVNMPVVQPDPATMDALQPEEEDAMAAFRAYQAYDSGYSKQQSTRPQTLGYALADSPVGQLAWVVEKFQSWTDCGGHPENAISRDALLDTVMVYWLNNAGASSARLYWESFERPNLDPVDIPAGVSIFPKEIMRPSRRWVARRYRNLVHYNRLAHGGHFAALEQPAAFVHELRKCFRACRL